MLAILHSSTILVVAVLCLMFIVAFVIVVICFDDTATASSCDSLAQFWGRSSSERVINETAELLIFLVIVASIALERIFLDCLCRRRAALSVLRLHFGSVSL